MQLQEMFERQFPHDKNYHLLHCPYRVCPLGAHVDHQYGLVTGFDLDKGVTLCFAPVKQPQVTLYSTTFAGEVCFDICSSIHREKDWGDYARAAASALMAHGYRLNHGLCGIVEGSLPIGGLSSSAAVIIVYILALCQVNAIRLEASALIAIALWAENQYVGVNVGKLDQSCEVYCRKDHLLYLDTQNDSFELIPKNAKMPPFQIAVLFSGISRALVDSEYNARVDECKAAAYALKAFAGIPYGRVSDTRLRDVPYEVFERFRERLPENWAKRAAHYFTEVGRVRRGVDAWENGDIQMLGQIIYESGNSSIYNYESGSPELRALHEIMLEAPGIYGGRFSGAGFKGCCMAIIDPVQGERMAEYITRRYVDRFPHLQESFSIHFCESADGVGVL